MMSTIHWQKKVARVKSLEQIRSLLDGKNLFEISRQSGVSYNTIRAIASGGEVNPTYNTMKAISDYLERS